MERIVLAGAFFLVYFMIGGLATTNILRLTAGNRLPVRSSKCVCDNCGARITPFLQLPIISYVICKGRCRSCQIKLPVSALLLEIFVLAGMFGISCALSFSFLGVTVSFVYYEIVRVILILKEGRREEAFGKQYVIAMLSMIPFYLITLFVSLLYATV